jgi:hypothetical protein
MSKKESSIPTDTEGKLKQLDDIENKIADAIKNAGLTITELGRENINAKNADKYTLKFLNELDEVETELSRIINYLGQVTCNTTHEGSVYGRVRENDHLKSASGSALLRSKHLMELTAPDKVTIPQQYRLTQP